MVGDGVELLIEHCSEEDSGLWTISRNSHSVVSVTFVLCDSVMFSCIDCDSMNICH